MYDVTWRHATCCTLVVIFCGYRDPRTNEKGRYIRKRYLRCVVTIIFDMKNHDGGLVTAWFYSNTKCIMIPFVIITIWDVVWRWSYPLNRLLAQRVKLHPHSADLRHVVHTVTTCSRSERQASHPWGKQQETEVDRWGWRRLVGIEIFGSFIVVRIDDIEYFESFVWLYDMFAPDIQVKWCVYRYVIFVIIILVQWGLKYDVKIQTQATVVTRHVSFTAIT